MSMRQHIKNGFNRSAHFFRRHKWHFLIATITIVLIELVVQLVYPNDRMLPLLSAQSNVQVTEAAEYYQRQFAATEIVFAARDKSITMPLSSLGATLDIDAMLNATPGYPLWLRLVPFSLFWHHNFADTLAVSYSDSELASRAATIATELSLDSVDAGISIKDGEVVTTDASAGWDVDEQAVVRAIRGKSYRVGTQKHTVEVNASDIEPSISEDDVAQIKGAAQSILSNKFIVHVPDHDAIDVPVATLASWISFKEDDSGQLVIAANINTITSYINEINSDVAIAAGVTTVQYKDGVEVSRSTGKSGKGINKDMLKEEIASHIEKSTNDAVTIDAEFVAIEPTVKKENSYSNSQAGLRAYVNDETSDGSIKISVQQIGGAGWSASGGASDGFVSASTYKPYVILRMFEDIDNGKLQWSDKIVGMSLTDCLEKTIVVSANECAMALIDKYGGANLTNYLHGKGFSNGTGFTFSDATHTTAGDLTNYMARLEKGSLMSSGNRTKLLDAMRRQVYRQGVPAGTSANVADKVGFLWDYLNDTAIVYHPQGTYVITVLTKGQSWAKIAEITRQVERILYG